MAGLAGYCRRQPLVGGADRGGQRRIIRDRQVFELEDGRRRLELVGDLLEAGLNEQRRLEGQAAELWAAAKQRRDAEERADTLRKECEALHKRAEDNLVELCDLRVQLNRLENERDDAQDERRKKIKKILSKVHAALDEAGAPRGEDLSFGERIRWLKKQLES